MYALLKTFPFLYVLTLLVYNKINNILTSSFSVLIILQIELSHNELSYFNIPISIMNHDRIYHADDSYSETFSRQLAAAILWRQGNYIARPNFDK